MFIMSKFTI